MWSKARFSIMQTMTYLIGDAAGAAVDAAASAASAARERK
jgi:hypothetical protein